MAQRNTIQKTIVAEALRTLANHPTADEVYDRVHAQHPSVSKATVYRVLNSLAEEGLALRVRINNGADRFDHQVFPHHHVRCTQCGNVDDVAVDLPQSLLNEAQRTSGYLVTSYALQFDGICPACQQHGKEERLDR